MSQILVADLLIILVSGFMAGVLCRFLKIPMLVGYIAVGALVGGGGLDLMGGRHHEIEYLAEAGALLLLFSIGLEFSLKELTSLKRHIVLGGAVQMLLVALPTALVAAAFGLEWRPAVFLGLAVALSSTVLVFKSLAEYGQTTSQGGRRMLSILLFQDIAIVPILLLVPLLTGSESGRGISDYFLLALSSIFFVAVIPLLRKILQVWVAPFLSERRSPELIVLFVLSLLGVMMELTHLVGLSPALGAFACGLMLNGNRLTAQIDALVLPFRETFAAIFFVGLGILFNPKIIMMAPLFAACAFAGVLLLKSLAACVAARLTGVPWRPALGIGVGLAQIGEFAFILAFSGVQAGLIMTTHYDFLLVFALGSLVLTPFLLQAGQRLMATAEDQGGQGEGVSDGLVTDEIDKALVIGIGHIGRMISLHLETRGFYVCALDMSPVNLHPLSLQGIKTVTGDACDPETLARARVGDAQLVVLCVPDDAMAVEIVKSLRTFNADCTVIVRCRYRLTAEQLQSLGASIIITEETLTATELLSVLSEKDMI